MISIFAKNSYLLDGANNSLFLYRVSSRVRGEEIARFLGARLNPEKDYENDLCIYVKPQSMDHIKDGHYVDVLDNTHALPLLKARPGVKVIAMSRPHYEFFKKELKNEVVFIPHHHINFERASRNRKEITVAGYIGAGFNYHHRINDGVKRRLATIGLDFVPLFSYQARKDIIDYYKKIDIQIIGYFNYPSDNVYRHPTKIINAASFGIPTIATQILGYKEFEEYYIPVNDMASLVAEAKKMKDQKYYNRWSTKVKKEAEKYHISKIAKLYQQLA